MTGLTPSTYQTPGVKGTEDGQRRSEISYLCRVNQRTSQQRHRESGFQALRTLLTALPYLRYPLVPPRRFSEPRPPSTGRVRRSWGGSGPDPGAPCPESLREGWGMGVGKSMGVGVPPDGTQAGVSLRRSSAMRSHANHGPVSGVATDRHSSLLLPGRFTPPPVTGNGQRPVPLRGRFLA